MAQTTVPQVLHLGFLIPVGEHDLEADDLTPKASPGVYSIVIDKFGTRIFSYGRNRESTRVSLGEFLSSQGDENGLTVVTAATGTTTRVELASAVLTAGAHVGSLIGVVSNSDGAGSAPEGEVGVIVNNTSDHVDIDASRPFSVAVGAGDVLNIVGGHNLEYSVGNPTPDTAFAVYGCVVAQNGISANNYGWFQKWGYVPQCNYSSGGASAGQPLVIASTTAEVVGQSGAAVKNIVGYAPFSVAGSVKAAGGKAMAFLQLGFGVGPSATAA